MKKPSKRKELNLEPERKDKVPNLNHGPRKTGQQYLTESRIPVKSRYNESFCDMLVAHMAKGFSFDSFAAIVNVPKTYLFRWLNDFPEWAYAKSVGESHYFLWWENEGKEGVKSPSFNSSAWIFNMKNRFSWYDRNVTHVFPITLNRTLEIEAEHFQTKDTVNLPEMRVREHIETV